MSVEAATRDAVAAALAREAWNVENVELVTVGVDVGSSTSHVMFSRVHLRREAQSLSSRFVVVERTTLWRSPIVLTPYLDDETIDAEALEELLVASYREAGLERDDVDSGAVILTGQAIRRRNARAIADLVAGESGRFVCASAGHHMESGMAAHGSGAVELSRELDGPLLHVDVGGGTSKLALVAGGEVLDTAAIAVGGRLLAFDDDGIVTRVEEPAVAVARRLGASLAVGAPVEPAVRAEVAEALADALAELVAAGGASSKATRSLLVTDPPSWPAAPVALSISGGVAEYVYGRESERFGDLAPELAAAIADRIADGRIALALIEPPQGIRATAIGASQFTVQVSGNTVSISDPSVLPRRGVPVVRPRVELTGPVDSGAVAAAIVDAARRMDLLELGGELAVALPWRGEPSHARLHALASGVLTARERIERSGDPVVLLLEGDVAKSIGHLLVAELGVSEPVVCLDGLELREFDYVDIGAVIEPTGVVPVVIKSLLFGATDGFARAAGRYPEASTRRTR